MNGQVNYAFIILLRYPDKEKFDRLTGMLRIEKVEFRRGTAGGGNLARQPFVRKYLPEFDPAILKNADYIHFYGLYTGNYPSLEKDKILRLCDVLNTL